MDWITDEIAIGSRVDAEDVELLRRHRFVSVLSLDGAFTGMAAADLGLKEVVVVPLADGPGNDPGLFDRVLGILGRLVRDCPPVLVQCHAGRSRSVVVVAGFLMLSRGLDADGALAFVARRREIAVTEGLERLLDSLE